MRGSTAGIGDNFKGRNRPHYLLLSVLDSLLACVVVAPLTIACWRGCWELMDVYVLEDRPLASAAVSFLVGASGQLLLGVYQRPIAAALRPDRRRLTYYLASRSYTVTFGVACIGYWRSIFVSLNLAVGSSEWMLWAMTVVAASAMLASRTARNVAAPPFIIAVDSRESYFEVPTMFRLSTEQDTGMYVLDCMFSIMVIGTLAVVVWKGVWGILDVYLFPKDLTWSAWGSLLLGYGVVLAMFALQSPMKTLCSRLDNRPRIVVADTYMLASFFGTVNVWRGVWNLLDIYFLPESQQLSCWLTFVVSLVIMIFMNCSNSMLVRGVYRDGEEDGGKCVVFPCYYLRLYFQKKRKERLHQLQVDHMKKQLQVSPDGGDPDHSSSNHHLHVPLMVPRLAIEPPEDD